MNVKERAEQWKPAPKIQDLGVIAVDVEMFDDGVGVNDEGKEYYFSYILNADGKQIRVPESVLSQLQDQLKVNPTMKGFKVNHNGKTGFQSKYTVIPVLQ